MVPYTINGNDINTTNIMYTIYNIQNIQLNNCKIKSKTFPQK